MRNIYKFWALAALFPCLALAQATPFALKGKTLGMDQAQACEGAAVDGFKRSKEVADEKGIVYLGSACDLPISSVAGITDVQSLGLVFWDRKLIRIIALIDPMSMDRAAIVRGRLMDAYGKPVTRRNRPFVTDTWKNKTQVLELEMTWSDGDPSAAGIYLTDIRGWDLLMKATERVGRAIADEDKRSRQSDLLR